MQLKPSIRATMYHIHPVNALWTPEKLTEGRIVNQVTVDDDIAEKAEVALGRMLRLRQ